MQRHCVSRTSFLFIIHCRIMLSGSINVIVPQNLCHKINITGLLIKCRTIGTAQLMRCNMLKRSDLRSIFIHQISIACTLMRRFWIE